MSDEKVEVSKGRLQLLVGLYIGPREACTDERSDPSCDLCACFDAESGCDDAGPGAPILL